jgi:hypothetical protein
VDGDLILTIEWKAHWGLRTEKTDIADRALFLYSQTQFGRKPHKNNYYKLMTMMSRTKL